MNVWEKIREKLSLGSLKKQLMVRFIGLLLLLVVAISVINHLLLESYYIARKKDALLQAKEALSETDFQSIMDGDVSEDGDALEEGGGSGLFSYSLLQKGSSWQNFSWVVFDPDKAKSCCYPSDDMILRSKIFGYVFGMDTDSSQGKVLSRYNDCVVQMVYDRFADMDYLECWGEFASGLFFLIRTPIKSIRESAAISNTFYLWVGSFIIGLGALLVWVFARKVTKPMIELTALSEKMSNLDFSVRYTSHAGNEIDRLGENFNKLSAQLESTISELKRANLELQADIEDKIKIDTMRKEFLDNVSHELKTPIALISGYAEGLRDGISDDPESMQMYCDVIIDESAKMNRLVMSLLTLNQLESGGEPPAMERFDLVAFIQGELAKMEILIEQSGAKVLFREENPVYVWADAFGTEQVLGNYLSNALHHLEGENIIDIRIRREGDLAKVTVFNSGKPIPEEDLPNLWTKFYKVDKARTREYGGSGIGLSIVKAILESMHQEYGVQNYDNGVEFWFTLDCSEKA